MAFSTTSKLMAALALASSVSAHSWTEQITLISPNGTYVGPFGYPRGYVARTDPTFTGGSMVNLLPALSTGRDRVNGSDQVCMSSQQSSTQQPSAYPRLQVTPGSTIALRNLENGHVSLPQNQPGKPPKGGSTFVFGTSQPENDELLVDILSWTPDGKGGDARGKLLAANNYDDGRCRQINSGAISIARQQEFPNPIPGQPGTNLEIWCETTVKLPDDLTPGSLYTAYWVWDWKTEAGTPGVEAGKDEYYTTCMDFEVVETAPLNQPVANALEQQDPNTKAVRDWMSRTAVYPNPNVTFATMADWSGIIWNSVASSTISAATRTSTSHVTVTSTTSTTTISLSTVGVPPTAASSELLPTTQTTTPISTVSVVPVAASSDLLPISVLPTLIMPSSTRTNAGASFGTAAPKATFGTPAVRVANASISATTMSNGTTLPPMPAVDIPGYSTSDLPTSLLGTSLLPTSLLRTSLLPSSLLPSSEPFTALSSSYTSSWTNSSSAAISTSTTSAADGPITMTAVLTVTGVLQPGTGTLIVTGQHAVTFYAPSS